MGDFFRTWLPQMIGYARQISDESEIRRAWIHSDNRGTTLFYPGELFAQLYDGMNIDIMRNEINQCLSSHGTLRDAMQDFIGRIADLESWVRRQNPYPSGESILASPEWRTLRNSAGAVVLAAKDAGFSESDFNPGEGG